MLQPSLLKYSCFLIKLKKKAHFCSNCASIHSKIKFSSNGGSSNSNSYLVEGVLNGDDGRPLDEAEVHVFELVGADPVCLLGLGVLEVKVVLLLLPELGGRHVHGDLDLAGVASLLNGGNQKVNGLLKTEKKRLLGEAKKKKEHSNKFLGWVVEPLNRLLNRITN